ALLAGPAEKLPIGAVLKLVCRISKITGEVFPADVAGAYIVEVVGQGEAVGDLEADVESRLDPVLEAEAYGEAYRYRFILPLVVAAQVLALCAELTQVMPAAV